jgi:methylmalonyl-CoA/ethylmalonyl-CoA epimerase
MNLHHLGFLTSNIEKSIEQFKLLGYVQGPLIIDTYRHLKICFLKGSGSESLELIEPGTEADTLKEHLNNRGVGLYHLCFETDKLTSSIENLTENGFVVIQSPSPALAFEGRSIAFLHATHTGIIELVEKN